MKQVDDKKIYTVSEVNYFAKQTLEQMTFWVEGEISELKKHPTLSFYYLKLKDEKTVLPCISSGHLVEGLGEDLTGQKVIVYGNLSLYEPWGKYQFRIARIEKFGEGFLQKQLEQLIKKLRSEGLFDTKYKKEIPKYPKRICIVTSDGSDAWNDFKRHTVDKFPIIELYTADVRVQGPKSIPGLLKVLPKVDKLNFDVIVITRGGGSIEDLAAFNDEKVARAIFKIKTPTVVAIGHEANESLAEWVADRRASTPNDAANIVTAGYQSLLITLDDAKYRLSSKANYYFSTNFQRLDYIYLRLQQTKTTFKDLPSRLRIVEETLKRHEKYLIADAKVTFGNLSQQLVKYWQDLMRNKAQMLEGLGKSLILLSPANTLARGYAIATNAKGQVLKSIRGIVVGNLIGVKLSDGRINSKVLGKKLDD